MRHDNNGNGDNGNKFQTARIFCVELKNGPEHGIHIVALLRKGKWQRFSWNTELCVKKPSVF